jgi:hypothetical protein
MTLPPLEWDKDNPVAAERFQNALAARKCPARRTDREEESSRRIAYLEGELKTSQKSEKSWTEQAQNHDKSSAPPGSTLKSKQDILSPSKVPNRISILSLTESVSTVAYEPRDITAISPRPRKIGWDRGDPITATHTYNTFSARPCPERELGNSQEREKFWKKQSQTHDESSAPFGSTFQTNQDVSSPSGVSNGISISSLINSNSTGACEPRDSIQSSQVRQFKCPHSGCIAAPFRTEYKLK